jgi:hypothetical protein
MAGTDALVPASIMLISSVTLVIVLLLTARGWLPRGYFAKRAKTPPAASVRIERNERDLVGAGRSQS